MSRAVDTGIALAVIILLLGIIGAMDYRDQQRQADHVAQCDRQVALEAVRRQAEWAVLTHKAQRMSGFPATVAAK